MNQTVIRGYSLVGFIPIITQDGKPKSDVSVSGVTLYTVFHDGQAPQEKITHSKTSYDQNVFVDDFSSHYYGCPMVCAVPFWPLVDL